MNQIYDEIIIKPLSVIYKNYIENGIFPGVWKTIMGIIFERILFHSLHEFLQENSFLCEHQSGFSPSDLRLYQLLSNAHETYASFFFQPTIRCCSNIPEYS